MPGPKWTTLQATGQQKSEAIHLMSTGSLSNGQLRIHSTSSTAQGGGGSLKNRKPIGEIGCCESGMAERIH